MPLFTYKAADVSGNIVKGTLDAANEAGAASRIQDKGLIPITIAASGRQSRLLDSAVGNPLQTLFNRVTGKDVMLFTQDLSSLLEAGLPVDRSLAVLVNVTGKTKLKSVITEMLRSVQGGAYLSDALAKYPTIFSSLYVNMVRAGEASGALEDVLKRLGIYLQSTQELKEFIVSALVYPVFLICVSGASIIILMTYVIPKFSVIFNDLGGNIPLSSRLLLDMSYLLRSYWWAVIIGIITTVVAVRQYKRTERGRLALDRIKLKLPIVRDLVQKAEVARFTRTLGVLMRSGVPILQGIDLVARIINNRIIAKSLEQVHARVKKGDQLAKTLENEGLFPQLALQMITVGEETGRLEEMLLRVAENYENALKILVKRFISFLEPAMILVMAVVVGFIVISMLMAIFSMNELPF